MRYVHLSEFQSEGMASCPDGKYDKYANIDMDYRNVNCSNLVYMTDDLKNRTD